MQKLIANEAYFTDKGDYYTLLATVSNSAYQAVQYSKKVLQSEPDCLQYAWNLYIWYIDNHQEGEAEKMLGRLNALCRDAIQNKEVDSRQKVVAYSKRIRILDLLLAKPEILKNAIKAKKIFDAIEDPLMKDYWEFEQIKGVVACLPEHMQDEFYRA